MFYTVVKRCCVTKDHDEPVFYNLVESKICWFAFNCIIQYLSFYIFSVQVHMRFVFDCQINILRFKFAFHLDE